MDRLPFRTLMTRNFPGAPPRCNCWRTCSFSAHSAELELNPAQVELQAPVRTAIQTVCCSRLGIPFHSISIGETALAAAPGSTGFSLDARVWKALTGRRRYHRNGNAGHDA
jgi:hypothetical protein